MSFCLPMRFIYRRRGQGGKAFPPALKAWTTCSTATPARRPRPGKLPTPRPPPFFIERFLLEGSPARDLSPCLSDFSTGARERKGGSFGKASPSLQWVQFGVLAVCVPSVGRSVACRHQSAIERTDRPCSQVYACPSPGHGLAASRCAFGWCPLYALATSSPAGRRSRANGQVCRSYKPGCV